jgi:predicted ribosomally synthesized peptide with SipW-like signal peptide
MERIRSGDPFRGNRAQGKQKMTDEIDLSRRKVLGGLATIGVAGAGAGLGTSAFFSDQETFTNNQLVAGELDMKVGYSAHYSDWSPDEDGSHTPDDESDDVQVRMYEGAPNTTGDEEDLEEGETGLPTNDAWLIAVDDPEQFLENTQYQSGGSANCEVGTDAQDVEQPVIDLDDVKPGDFGEVTFDFALCDNPGYVWLQGGLVSASENGTTEPEAEDDDEDEGVELLDVVQVAAWVDDGNNYQNGEEAPNYIGSLRDVIVGDLGEATPPGVALPGDLTAEEGGGTGEQGCFSANEEHSVAFAWWVPVDHGNEIQTDSATFDLGFYTEQCRHNDGSGQVGNDDSAGGDSTQS